MQERDAILREQREARDWLADHPPDGTIQRDRDRFGAMLGIQDMEKEMLLCRQFTKHTGGVKS